MNYVKSESLIVPIDTEALRPMEYFLTQKVWHIAADLLLALTIRASKLTTNFEVSHKS